MTKSYLATAFVAAFSIFLYLEWPEGQMGQMGQTDDLVGSSPRAEAPATALAPSTGAQRLQLAKASNGLVAKTARTATRTKQPVATSNRVAAIQRDTESIADLRQRQSEASMERLRRLAQERRAIELAELEINQNSSVDDPSRWEH
jgi:hypothetical protein